MRPGIDRMPTRLDAEPASGRARPTGWKAVVHFNKLDLNLLVALDALLTERSITRAAHKVQLSQSSMSNALNRLRDHFDDKLLVQMGRSMQLTPRAESLCHPVRDVLVRIEATVRDRPGFDPTQSQRCFRINLSDYSMQVLIPHFQTMVAKQGFAGRFDFLVQVTNPALELERGETDLLIIPNGFQSKEHPSEHLFEDRFVCIMWRDSRLAERELTYEAYLAASHVEMRPAGTRHSSAESWMIKHHGISRQVFASTYAFGTLFSLVVGTESVATVHARLARVLGAAWPIVVRPLPITMKPFQQALQWHTHSSRDPGMVWLRGMLQQAAARMDADGG
jgi:LysR family transcriptional regulator, nod-box dependent transcriptional activator